jgi:hypothetical protein
LTPKIRRAALANRALREKLSGDAARSTDAESRFFRVLGARGHARRRLRLVEPEPGRGLER